MVCGSTRFLVPSAALAVAALTLTGCSGDDAVSVDDLAIVDVKTLDLPVGDAFLSPDGERIATYADTELCLFNTDGDKERCVDLPVDLDSNSIQWNSDGSRLLFTENFFVLSVEPDIWSLDAASGELTNLTDDGVEPDELNLMPETEGSDTAQLDTVPMWVDDDSTVRFLRWERAAGSVAIMEVPADGGDAEEVGILATDTPPATIAYTDDGERAIYSRTTEEDVVIADLKGEEATPIIDDPAHTALLSSGHEALLAPVGAGYFGSDDAPPLQIFPVDGGEADPIDAPITWATWRTGGDELAYAELGTDVPGETIVRVAAESDAEARELTTGTFSMPYNRAPWRLPVWSEQDTMLLVEPTDDPANVEYVLVQLGEE